MCIFLNNVSKFVPSISTPPLFEQEKAISQTEETAGEEEFAKCIVKFKEELISLAEETFGDKFDEDFIKQRIDKLYPVENFYCYKWRKDKKEMNLEWTQIMKFL